MAPASPLHHLTTDMRILITGGARFLGYHLPSLCAERGDTPAVFDVAACNPAEYPPNAEFFTGDVRDRAAVERALAPGSGARPPDVVVHAAAALPLWRPDDIRSTNVEGTRTVLAAARAAGVGRVVYISSTAVYGVPEKHPLEEDDPLVSVGPYGESKIAAERLCAEFRVQGY